MLLLGMPVGAKLLAQVPAGSRPGLAVLPLKAEGRQDLGDVSDTLNMLVANAFADSGAFRLVERSQVMAALPGLKLQESAPGYRTAMAELGRRLSARFILVGSYLPERDPLSHNVSVTLALRLVNAADGTVAKSFLENGEGPTLGSVVASLNRQLSAKAAGSSPAIVPVPTAVPSPAVVPAPVVVPAPAIVPAPAAVPAPAVVPAPVIVPAPPVAATPAMEPAPVPATAPLPRKSATALLVLREGTTNGIYYRNGGLSQFGAKLEDFAFLPQNLAKLFPPEVKINIRIGARETTDDATLNRNLAKTLQPDTMVVLTLDCNTRSERSHLVLTKTLIQAALRIEFLAPGNLEVLASKTVQTDYLEGKGLREKLSGELKEQLAKRMAAALPALPF
jgi:hypothetical protein